MKQQHEEHQEQVKTMHEQHQAQLDAVLSAIRDCHPSHESHLKITPFQETEDVQDFLDAFEVICGSNMSMKRNEYYACHHCSMDELELFVRIWASVVGSSFAHTVGQEMQNLTIGLQGD